MFDTETLIAYNWRMTHPDSSIYLPEAEAKQLNLAAGKVFTPTTPISHREFFAGRWDEITALVDAVAQIGLHVALYGERGVGKSSLANVVPIILQVFDKDATPPRPTPRISVRVNAHSTDTFSHVWRRLLDQITWEEDTPTIGFKPTPGKKRIPIREAYGLGDDLTIEVVRGVLSSMPGSVFVIDEFDRISQNHVTDFTDLIKDLADSGIDSTVVLVGVAETVDALIKDHASISRSLIQIHLRRMSTEELRAIVQNAEKSLQIAFESGARESIVMMSQGLPHWTHLIGLHAVRSAAERRSRLVTKQDVATAFKEAIKAADHSITQAYANAIRSAHKGALYQQVLLACAIAAAQDADGGGYFKPSSLVDPLTVILRRDSAVEIATFNKHLGEFCENKRAVLERTGLARGYRYRFCNPLMPSFVLIRGIAEKLIADEDLTAFMKDAPLAN